MRDIAHVYEERGLVRVNPRDSAPVAVEVGCNQPVIIDKMFGPLIFADIRVTADFQSGEWVIERQRIDSLEWVEVFRIAGQVDHEFDETHPDHREIGDAE